MDETALGVCSKRAVIRLKCEKSLDEIALAIGLSECSGIVVFVGKNLSSRDVGDKGLGLGVVAGLPWRQDEAQRIAQGIDNGANESWWSARRMLVRPDDDRIDHDVFKVGIVGHHGKKPILHAVLGSAGKADKRTPPIQAPFLKRSLDHIFETSGILNANST